MLFIFIYREYVKECITERQCLDLAMPNYPDDLESDKETRTEKHCCEVFGGVVANNDVTVHRWLLLKRWEYAFSMVTSTSRHLAQIGGSPSTYKESIGQSKVSCFSGSLPAGTHFQWSFGDRERGSMLWV